MTEMDTSRPAVEALIETVRNKYGAFDHFHRELADAAAALLDERDGLREDRQMQRESLHHAVERISDLEATNRKIIERSANHHNNAIKWRDCAERAERAVAKLDAAKAALNASYHEPTNRVWHEQMQRLRAILTDTNEGNEQ